MNQKKEVSLMTWFFLCECFLINICPSVKKVRLIWATGEWKTKWREKERVLKLITVADCDGTVCDGPPVQLRTDPHGMSEWVCFKSFGELRDTVCNLIPSPSHFSHTRPRPSSSYRIGNLFGVLLKIAITARCTSVFSMNGFQRA
jgi:hypothetical protein